MKYDSLTVERLREMLDYDPATGVFTWKTRPFPNSRKRAGDVAGALKGKGYRYIGLDNRTYLASQLAWLHAHGQWATGQVGIKNGDPSDLRLENLVEMKTAPGKHDFKTREGRLQYRRAFREANPGIHRTYGFKRYYGMSLDEYQRLFVEQKGVCAICEQPERAKSKYNPKGEPKWLSVDHDHKTKKVRGLLCHNCNSLIGHAKEDIGILRKAAEYLEQHDKETLNGT